MARGQSPLDGFDPNANGKVNVTIVQSDGKILIGGGFTVLSPNGTLGVERNRIARLNPDGTHDTAFNPNSDDEIYAIARQSDGKILVGGRFTHIGGQTRNGVARLDAVTGQADSFDPGSGSVVVYSMAIEPNGKILVGGQFSAVGGQFRSNIARLDPTTGLADSFNPSANGIVYSIVRQADGNILVGGAFNGANSIGGQTRNRIARLASSNGVADSFNPNANNNVLAIAMQADGNILVGGDFNGASSIGGADRNRIARLDRNTGLADSLNPNANGSIASILVQADGRIVAAGQFHGPNSIGGQNRDYVARLDATSGVADSFDPKPNGAVGSIAVRPDGKIVLGGNFGTVMPNGQTAVTRNNIALLEKEGTVDQTLNLSIGFANNGVFPDPDVEALALQADGKIVIAGTFGSVLGVQRKSIARLNPDGTLDPSFNPGITSQCYVAALTVQPDGKILVGGQFTTIGGISRPSLARLDPVTGLPDSFAPNAGDTVAAIVMQPDGKILVGGFFQTMGGMSRLRLARIDPNTAVPDSFNPQANSFVQAIAVQRDGKIVVGGSFSTIGGQSRQAIARLDPVTGLADSFNPIPNGATVRSILIQPDGKILVSGFFSFIGGQPRNGLARLDPDTGLADSFYPPPDSFDTPIAIQADGKILAGGSTVAGSSYQLLRLDPVTGQADSFHAAAGEIRVFALQPDGKVLAGGPFRIVAGLRRPALARFTNDIPAFQDLVVTPASVTWIRGGSSIQFARVTFEYSTDNVNYIVLGEGHPAGSNWELTRLSLPIGQNIYVRGRARYTVVGYGSSESVAVEVRNVFLTGEPTPTPVPTQTPGPATPTPTPTIAPTPTPLPSATPTVTPTCGISEDFDNVTTLPGAAWVEINHSVPSGTTGWFQGNGAVFPAQSGGATSYIAANFQNGGRPGALRDSWKGSRLTTPLSMPNEPGPTPTVTPGPTPFQAISDWLLTPPLLLQNGATMTFYTRTVDLPQYPDRLQVRMSTNATSTNVGANPMQVGDFSTLLLEINPSLTTNGYPSVWTQYIVTVNGVATQTVGRLALRYYVPNGGPNQPNADYIGIDTVRFYGTGPCPSPTPASTPIPINISGTISYCSNPVPGPVPNVTLTLTGTMSGATLSDGSGNYQLSLTSGGSYTVTPAKSARTPGTLGINTVDVLATQRHFLILGTPLSGCRLIAADVNGDLSINTIDVIAIQRFFLGYATGISNSGRYQFNPSSRTYSAIVSDQTGRNYDTLIFGDVASPFVE